MAMRRALCALLRAPSRPQLKTLTPASPKTLPFLLPPRRLLSSSSSPPLSAAAEEAFESAKTTGDLLAAFSQLQSALPSDDRRLALACLKLGQHLDATSSSPDHKRVLSLAVRAVRILDSAAAAASPPASSDAVSLAMALHLAGAASFELGRFNDSLSFLTRAQRLLSPFLAQKGDTFDTFDVRPVAHAVRFQLANAKTALGRREEALADLRACLALKEEILPPDSRELGAACRDLAEAYAAVLNFQEALPLCLRALEIHERQLGKNSVEVAHGRRLLGVIYTGLEQYEQALAQNEMSRNVLHSWGMGGADFLHAEIDAANIQIAMGKFDEAVGLLKNVAGQLEKDSDTRALVFVSMAKALAHQEKVTDTKKCLQIACDILEKKETTSPDKVAEAYVEISSVYEMVNKLDTAISLLKRSLVMLERIPQEQHMVGNVSARIGWLLLLTGKVSEAIPHLEDALERMKESFGPKHYGVGYVYNNLGAAYMEMDRLQSAAQMFALAKEIMDVSLGPHHSDSIEACQSLANAYSAMGSYALAMEFQNQVIVSWRNHGPSAKEELKEAIRLYEQLEIKALASLPIGDAEDALPQPQESGADSTKSVQQ